MNKKKILIISLTDQSRDPRVLRQMKFLKDKYEIYSSGLSNDDIEREKFFPIETNNSSVLVKINIGLLKLFRLYELAEDYFLKAKAKVNTKHTHIKFDLIIANDLDGVHLAYNSFKSRKVLADFHEFTQSEFDDRFYFKNIQKGFVIYMCRKYFPVLDDITTVCHSIANEFGKQYSRFPKVITNAPEFHDLQPSKSQDKIRIIHHGAAIRSRKIELSIETVKLLDDRFTLDLMLMANEQTYYDELKEMVRGIDRIRIIEPVAYNDIITFSNYYDIGLFILPPANLNYEYALPNKFFEFVQSRLAVITGPSVEMSEYIKKYDLGISTKSFVPEEIAEEINGLTREQIEWFKHQSHLNARELSADSNKDILNSIVSNLIDN